MNAWDESEKRRAKSAKRKRLEEGKQRTNAIHRHIAKKRLPDEGDDEESEATDNKGLLAKASTMSTMWDDETASCRSNATDADEWDDEEDEDADADVNAEEDAQCAVSSPDTNGDAAQGGGDSANHDNAANTEHIAATATLTDQPATASNTTKKPRRQMPKPPSTASTATHTADVSHVLGNPDHPRKKLPRHRALPTVPKAGRVLPTPPTHPTHVGAVLEDSTTPTIHAAATESSISAPLPNGAPPSALSDADAADGSDGWM